MYVTIGDLHIQNLVISESIAPTRLLAKLGYNASVGVDNVVEFMGFMAML